MEITILCTSADHPVNTWLERWQSLHQAEHNIQLCRDKADLTGGDILFLVSCSQVIGKQFRSSYRHTLVLHASDLPLGRGWSPYIWAILAGAEEVVVSLIEAEDSVDTGAIWTKRSFSLPRDALFEEIHRYLFETELALMDDALVLVEKGVRPSPQRQDIEPTYYPKRTPQDSELDPKLPLEELFNRIRVADPKRYPAFFRLHGHVYTIELRKVNENGND